jgi:PAS domain-containing protein
VNQFDDEDDPSGVFELPQGETLSAEERARIVAGRYEILERLGAGGMGQVLRVRHRRLGKAFALKLMHAELSTNVEAQQLFHREARLASHLSHPNIVEMIDFGNDPDWGWFIVMEFLEGEPLSKRIEQEGKLPIVVACQIAAQLADALVHSHAKTVVHADLKPSNVLCLNPSEAEPEPWRVKLFDFGAARVATAAGSTDRIDGTPEYLAPERITGGTPQASGSCCTTFTMLRGDALLRRGPVMILQRHQRRAPPAAPRWCATRLCAIIEKLAKNYKERYRTAQALLDDLLAYLDVLGARQLAGTLPALVPTDTRTDAAAAAFDALRMPAAGLLRDGTIVIANPAFARFLGLKDLTQVEGQNVHRTVLDELNPDMYDDLRLVALDGKLIRRYFTVPRPEKMVRVRYTLVPATGAVGHCMLLLHAV